MRGFLISRQPDTGRQLTQFLTHCKNNLPTVIAVGILLAIWKGLSFWIDAAIILPAPEETLKTCIALLLQPDFFSKIWHTVARSLVGFALALITALLLGIAAGSLKPVYNLLKPLVTITRATPTMSIILLALIWLHTEIAPILVGFLVIFPLLYSNIVEGIRAVDPELLEMAAVYRVKKRTVIKEIYLPSLSSYLIAGSATAMGLNLKVVIAAEVLSQPRNCIGTSLYMEQINLNTAGVFAWTIIAVLVSSGFDSYLQLFRAKIEGWKTAGNCKG
jgi:NitT/TauT family transport system permease protein